MSARLLGKGISGFNGHVHCPLGRRLIILICSLGKVVQIPHRGGRVPSRRFALAFVPELGFLGLEHASDCCFVATVEILKDGVHSS